MRLSFDIFVGCWIKNPGVSLKRSVLLFLQCHLVLQLFDDDDDDDGLEKGTKTTICDDPINL